MHTHIPSNPVLTVYFQKWANAGRCWAADQHLLRSYIRPVVQFSPLHHVRGVNS